MGGGTSHTFTPEGHDDAARAGAAVRVRVTARSGRDSTVSQTFSARLIGPAEVDARVNEEASEESISVSWREVKGANGYLIRRVMYSDTAMTSVASDSGNDLVATYYYDASSGKIALQPDGDVTGRATVSPSGAGFTLTDKYMESDTNDNDLKLYQNAQSKISWGLPFRYIVLPVLEKDDFDFIREFECEGKVTYKNLSPTDATATWGYGLNLVADKATSGTVQNIRWEEPYNAQRNGSAVLPVVYCRAAGSSGDFKKFSDQHDVRKGAKTGVLQINRDSYYDAFEYIVKYYSESELYYQDEITLPPSLSTVIEASKLEYHTPAGRLEEQNNKGYLLTLKDFRAEVSAKDYYEKIYWTAWSYTNRAVGPDTMTIRVQNNNIGDHFHDIVTVENAYVKNSSSIKVLSDDDDIKAEKEGDNAVLIAPRGIVAGTKGTTDGYLKVLRDYRHNYTFELQRRTDDALITVSYEDYVGKENSIKTAYRQITDEELVKTTMLTLADMEQDSGMEKQTTGGKWSLTGAAGTFTGNGSGSSELKWSIDNYQHKWRKLPAGQTNVPSFITLNDSGNNVRGRKYSAYLVYLCNGVFDTYDFSVDKLIPLTVNSDVYGTATIHFATGTDEKRKWETWHYTYSTTKRFIVKVEKNEKTTFEKSIEGEENCRYWCPMTWYASGGAGTQKGTGYFGESSQYGWWPPSN